jgi:glycosyltransferase involved in cell wall biosynthesis|tara:strand:+ start:165 stop:974 length:810 start_codon:yes stop_codon:yes gene_type:complete
MISIIMPVYNSSQYLKYAIDSVLNQTYKNWELLIINDGSTDKSSNIILSYDDDRVKYYVQKHQGVSAARNKALKLMRGKYFCFLDADDIMPPGSLLSRIMIFRKNSNISFVDGVVLTKNHKMDKTLRYYRPYFKGDPYNQLVKISDKCFFGPSWMIKRDNNFSYVFKENMDYLEDLYFYLSISNGGVYDYTKDIVLFYRKTFGSAMSNLTGLENGYYKLFNLIKTNHKSDLGTILYLKYKICRIMFSTYLIDGVNLRKAFSVILKCLLM